MNILVLGGTLFIGRRLVELLDRQRHQVTVLNRGVTPADLPANVASPHRGSHAGRHRHRRAQR